MASSAVAAAAVFGVGLLASTLFQPWRTGLGPRLRFLFGMAVAVNYLVFWLGPMGIQGAIHQQLLSPYVVPAYNWLNIWRPLRSFAERFVYSRPKHADYFVTQLIFLLNFAGLLALVVRIARMQLENGRVSWWSIAAYNFWWVGIGARNIGTAYFMAHKEAHNLAMYKPWIRNTVGNFFENWVGLLYGGVPNNFTAAHIALHHRLDGGLGDTLYCWDFDRSSWVDFMIYLSRTMLHQTGLGGLYQFYTSPRKDSSGIELRVLTRGVVIYWALLPPLLLWLVPSVSFFFWIVLQPLLCMGFFLALINQGFHAFIENDSDGRRIECVESVTLLGSDNNFFGEDDHMAHHYHPRVYWSEAGEHQDKQHELWAKHNASVFQGADIFCFSLFVLLKAWDILAARYMDFSGKLSKGEIIALLKARTSRREMEHAVLLPGLPASKARGYGIGPSLPKEEGGALYTTLLLCLASFQLVLAGLIEQGLPPVRELLPAQRPKAQSHASGGG